MGHPTMWHRAPPDGDARASESVASRIDSSAPAYRPVNVRWVPDGTARDWWPSCGAHGSASTRAPANRPLDVARVIRFDSGFPCFSLQYLSSPIYIWVDCDRVGARNDAAHPVKIR
jgi:hypothetical protein